MVLKTSGGHSLRASLPCLAHLALFTTTCSLICTYSCWVALVNYFPGLPFCLSHSEFSYGLLMYPLSSKGFWILFAFFFFFCICKHLALPEEVNGETKWSSYGSPWHRFSPLLVLKCFFSPSHLSVALLAYVANSACWPWGLIFGPWCIFENSLRFRYCNLWLWLTSVRSEILVLHKNASICVLQTCVSEQNYTPFKHFLFLLDNSILVHSITGHLFVSITHYSFWGSKKHFAILLWLLLFQYP